MFCHIMWIRLGVLRASIQILNIKFGRTLGDMGAELVSRPTRCALGVSISHGNAIEACLSYVSANYNLAFSYDKPQILSSSTNNINKHESSAPQLLNILMASNLQIKVSAEHLTRR
jgi:hypothetical protein